ncbi:MAG: hypothetical protein CO028_01730 [Candidatus Levybacteria bacterium CG_4_9_14_0_2_um_filter_35_21]|nr:MAG: hypothetical protein COW87_01785 [Candidatus Levybacteria bacterium CG22_combo_CG10-13_8_21_14_all_35_11]PJC54555.1 MAG: hypothetical protein CO028_01730 [Candidatus Levybacteria bacterium CG_4_9_14_0_2_um_filter_35_21]
MNVKTIETLIEIRKKYSSPENANELNQKRLTNLEKLALLVTEKIGIMGFFFIIFTWTVLWLSWNLFAPMEIRFDPYPSFVFWLFISNLIQLHLMPLIMIGQNIQGRHAQIRADHEYETNKKAEKEIEMILSHLENQNKLLDEILRKLK